ncbi:hypothetical protein NG798_22665 [Ancylothrix sp. C2]|uniref:hypothetical protein n=1 Tax=Ancylothrix sp. D3o TaxID=2953691 RepID=UPI0021BBB4DC|nr:hypothetical protein [Ancylothrix sp. D3o]MCT7952604.1 hypothetical protein [Ancylothrix sp. D3o]
MTLNGNFDERRLIINMIGELNFCCLERIKKAIEVEILLRQETEDLPPSLRIDG